MVLKRNIDSGNLIKTDLLDQKILDFFPEYASGSSDIQKRIVSIKHLLTMTAPIASKTTNRSFTFNSN